MKSFMAASMALILICTPALGQTKKNSRQPEPKAAPAFAVRVFVKVALDGPNLNIFKQCLFRELRKIPEVTVVEDQDQYNRYELRVVIIETKTVGGYHNGYAAAVNVVGPVNSEVIVALLTDNENKAFVHEFLGGAAFLEGLWAETNSSLDGVCRSVAASFETENIERLRQFKQKQRQQ